MRLCMHEIYRHKHTYHQSHFSHLITGVTTTRVDTHTTPSPHSKNDIYYALLWCGIPLLNVTSSHNCRSGTGCCRLKAVSAILSTSWRRVVIRGLGLSFTLPVVMNRFLSRSVVTLWQLYESATSRVLLPVLNIPMAAGLSRYERRGMILWHKKSYKWCFFDMPISRAHIHINKNSVLAVPRGPGANIAKSVHARRANKWHACRFKFVLIVAIRIICVCLCQECY